MIKKNLNLLFFFFFAISMTAQKNFVKIGAGIGSVPYESTVGLNLELQYEYLIKPGFSGFLSLGTSKDDFITQGRSQGTDGSVTWDNSWQFNYSERFNYMDAGVKYQVFKIGEKNLVKAVLGGSLGQSVYTFPENVFINRGIIEELDEVTRRVEVGMLLIGIENQILITDRLNLSLNFNFRTTFKERKILNTEITTHNNFLFSTSGILNTINLNLQAGYLF